MNGSNVGELKIALSFDGKSLKASQAKIGKEISSWGNGLSKAGKAAGGAIAAAGTGVIAAVSGMATTAIGLVGSSMDSAISRLDTLNNFPRVMESLGYSSEEASESIKSIGDSLDGLPTSLDAMANDVQKLAATMGNLAEGEVNATTVGLALNNAFLAGGKGTEAASAAMEQYNQMLARGKVDMQSWNSMVNAAPAQIDQLAKSILGADANQASLYAAMQNGTVTFEEFNSTLVRLNQEGGESFASFEEQARAASGGIATQLQNIQNTMNKVVAAALEGNEADMDKYINQLVDRVSQVAPTMITGFTKAFSAVMKALPRIVRELLPVIMEGINTVIMAIVEALPMVANLIVEAIPIIMDGLLTLLDALVQAIPTIVPQLMSAMQMITLTIVRKLSEPATLQAILQGAITLFLALIEAIPVLIQNLATNLPTIIANIVSFLIDPKTLGMIIKAGITLFLSLVKAVPQILGALIGAFASLFGQLWNRVSGMFTAFAGQFGQTVAGVFRGAINGVLAFIEGFINAPIRLINGFIDVINGAFGAVGVSIGKIGLIHLPRMAEGGLVTSATTAVIGEAGREAVLPLDRNTGWASLLADTLMEEMDDNAGREIVVNMTNNINSKLDAQEIGQIMMTSIRRAAA